MRKRVLFLYNWPSLYTFIKQAEHTQNVTVDLIWSPVCRRLVNVAWKLGLTQCMPYMLSKEAKKFSDYDAVIIPDSRHTPWLVDYFYKNNPKIKIVVWIWNTLWDNAPLYVNLAKRYQVTGRVVISTFDPNDAERYGLTYMPNFYFADLVENISRKNIPVRFDAIFVGAMKKRREQILKTKTLLDQAGLRSYFHVVPNQNKFEHAFNKILSLFGLRRSAQFIPYEDLIVLTNSSRAVVDIAGKGQSGMTLRVLEALFFHKKLITTNPYVKEMDFYCPENILVLTERTMPQEIDSFMKTPMTRIPEDIIEQYNFPTWIERFINR